MCHPLQKTWPLLRIICMYNCLETLAQLCPVNRLVAYYFIMNGERQREKHMLAKSVLFTSTTQELVLQKLECFASPTLYHLVISWTVPLHWQRLDKSIGKFKRFIIQVVGSITRFQSDCMALSCILLYLKVNSGEKVPGSWGDQCSAIKFLNWILATCLTAKSQFTSTMICSSLTKCWGVYLNWNEHTSHINRLQYSYMTPSIT